MKEYRIEIVRRACGRFGWNFLTIDDRGRRVLARSERTYRKKKRVRRVIAELEEACVVDATKDYGPVRLRATSFESVPGVVPLIVGDSPLELHDGVYKVLGRKAKKHHDRDQAAAREAEAAAHEAEAAALEAEAASEESEAAGAEQTSETRPNRGRTRQ